MKILITGGGSFIANNLFEQLSNKYNIDKYGREYLDLLDYHKVKKVLSENNYDVVIHTATYTHDKETMLEKNLEMFFNLENNNHLYGKMLYFGSGAEFSGENLIDAKETDFGNNIPTDPYGFSKYIMTKTAYTSFNIFNLRLFATFGKYDLNSRPIPALINQSFIYNKEIILEKNYFYDYLHVDDIVKVVDWFINNEPIHQVYNVCSGGGVDFKHIAEHIIRLSGKDLKLKILDNKSLKMYCGNNGELLNEIDFELTSFYTGLKNLYNYYKEFI